MRSPVTHHTIDDHALMIRAQAVHDAGLFSEEGLAMIIFPTPDVEKASLAAARERMEEEREAEIQRASQRPAKPPDTVRLIDLAA